MVKRNLVQRIADGVKDSVIAVAQAASDNVVQPVGKACGLTARKKPQTKSQIKAARKVMAESLSMKEQSIRKSKAAESMN